MAKDFNSDVPEETAALWVGTPYAAWIASHLNSTWKAFLNMWIGIGLELPKVRSGEGCAAEICQGGYIGVSEAWVEWSGGALLFEHVID